ncbi:MAG: DUF2279 domain-containing protein [Bacteroidia bacterium]
MKTYLLLFFLLASSYLGLAQRRVNTYPDSLNKRKLALVIGSEAAFYVGGMSYLQFLWYKDHERVPFHWYNDNAGYLQIDKMGHAYGAYFESMIGYHWLRKAGVPKKKALIYGGSLGLILQTPIEIFDGIYEGWGFSWGDMIANASGSALVVGQELLFDEQIARFKFSFWRSTYAKEANGYLGDNFLESLFYDYNGHTYWLSVPINRLMLKEQLPDWLCFSVGYSANGMFGEFENYRYYRGQWLPERERYRQFLFSLDIDTSRIHTRSKALNAVLKGLAFIKIPFPTLELNTIGKPQGHWIYF